MEQSQLSPHDETILFQLVEIERSLPREEQSRRFEIKILRRPSEAPEALIRSAATSKEFIMRTDAACFGELAKAGYVDGGRGGRVRSSGFEGTTTVDSLHTVQVTESAFRYYDEKHDFPTSLADERRQLVDSTISTAYPQVVAHLKKAYDTIWIEQPEGNWSSVALDCQSALRSFSDGVYKPEYASGLSEATPSSADFEKKLEQVIRANTRDEELRGLLVKLNAYANARRHDSGTTREEAKRCVLLTYLLLAEVWDVLASSEAA